MKEISRLRRKFIIYNMLIVTAVIGITFAALVCVLQSRGDEESRLILERAVEQPGERLIFDAVPQVRLPYFSVLVTENGEVIMRDGAYNSFPGAGYLERRPAKGDRRTRQLCLTEAGRAYADSKLAPLYAWEKAAMGRLTAAERTAMCQCNRKFMQALREGLEEEP